MQAGSLTRARHQQVAARPNPPASLLREPQRRNRASLPAPHPVPARRLCMNQRRRGLGVRRRSRNLSSSFSRRRLLPGSAT
jgi:hypothetical protein